MKYLKKFNTDSDRITYEDSENYIEPYVSYVEGDNSVHYNKPKFFCKLTLSNNSVVEIDGSGELTSTMINPYKSTLVGVEIGTLCTSIGTSVFYNCTGLTSITIPNSVTSIGNGAFENCTGLTSITIPNSVTSIGNGALYGCSGLINVIIGSGVASVGSGAFGNCSGLSIITSYIMTAPSVIPGTFNVGSSGGTLYVPQGSSGYETWMDNQGNLGYFGWTKIEQ